MGFKLTVEVPLVLIMFGYMLTASVTTNLLIYRTCYAYLDFNKSDCALLGIETNNKTKELEEKVEPVADVIGMVRSVVDSIAGSILCLFVAPWSDRFGRKPILVAGSLGGCFGMIVMAIFAFLESISPWYMMTSMIPNILTGGGAAFMTVLVSYLTDRTDERHRGIRLGILEGSMALGIITGNTSNAYILAATSYVAIYLIGACSFALAFCYIVFLLPESLENVETEHKFRSFFEWSNAEDMFRTAFKKRQNHRRAIILMLIFCLSVFFLIIAGDGSVSFLFLREKFQWSLVKYNWYNSATNVMWIVGTIFVIYVLHHLLKMQEIFIIFVGFLSQMCGMILTGVATKDWHIYFAAVIKIPGAGLNPMIRSIMSKLVDKTEVAKIFSVFSIGSSVLGLVGSPLYTSLYNATIDKDPGIFNFLTAGLHGVNTIIMMVIIVLGSRDPDPSYAHLINEDSAERTQENGRNSTEHSTEITH